MQIKANKESIARILNKRQHQIPEFQRRYAWDEQNIKEYWYDLKASDSPHFLGSMVTSGRDDDHAEVIDGQQRLTTALVALCAIRDQYIKFNETGLVEGIEGYIHFKDRDGKQRRTLFNKDSKSDEILNDYIVLKPGDSGRRESGSDVSLEVSAYETFTNIIEGELKGLDNNSAKVDELTKMRDRVLGAQVVYINVTDRENAFTIFETLNDRGVSLTTMDLVKNTLFRELPQGDENSGERSWQEIVHAVEGIKFSNIPPDYFLYYAWNSRAQGDNAGAVNIEQKALRKSIEEYVRQDGGGSPEENARKVIAELRKDASLLVAMQGTLFSYGDPGHLKGFAGNGEGNRRWRPEKFRELSEALYGVLVSSSNQPLPLVLALLRKYFYEKSAITHKLMLKYMREIGNFQFRWSVSKKGSSSSIRSLYRKCAVMVDLAKCSNDINVGIEEFRKRISKIQATDTQFINGISELKYSRGNMSDSYKIRHILFGVESSYSSPIAYDVHSTTLEHLRGIAKVSELSFRNYWMFKIGNLALLPSAVNSSLPESFKDKVETLRKYVNVDDVVLSRAITDGTWTADLARERLEFISDRATKVWPSV